MSEIKFSTEEKQIITNKIQKYFELELDQELGQFDAEFLLDFFSKEIGGYFYNRGVSDAKTVLDERIESISDALYEIEKPVSR
ncbi:DUF2164 domain-containing protein [Pelagibaculum spongiae]|uniref:DUF2164 domain-containing protein n=1 Tax=Pelagibaculum spongiae TaxID=2080658 RepID=A0A2V1GWP5_9GAMM|nr:DUF2164 domain-containing protein [Pelagibaculum spongiae]PVZ68368.1 DUF2164 domain-containing protein [Pelagibaculum spongiae]